MVPATAAYVVTVSGLNMKRRGARWVLTSNKVTVPIPPDFEQHVRWIIARKQFSSGELGRAFPATAAAGLEILLTDLSAMKVIQLI